MKLRNKFALCMGTVVLLFSVTVAISLSGMRNTTAKFESFIEQDQAFLSTSSSLYAQGLQMGQALRNIILQPGNKKGYTNLETARETFGKELQKAQALARGDAKTSAALEKVRTAHRQQAGLQDRIVALANEDQAAAIKLLNAEETPVWRLMRGELLNIIKEQNVAVGKTKTALVEHTQTMFKLSIAFALGAVVIGAVTAVWLTRNILRQLGGEPEYAAALASGIAAGDLTATISLDDESNTSSLLYAMQQMQQGLYTLVNEVRVGTDTITTATREITSGNLDLSARTEAQASALEQTAASMEELTSAVQQNAENVRQASDLADAASDVAMKGGKVVEDVVGTMVSINESAKHIAEIISVIDSIAFQTNILALNAAVEAARAGEQGRGFAVVASEVRSLAARSAAAAKEIKQLIGDSLGKVDAGSKLVNSAGATMKEVVTSVKRVTDLMREITVACKEQSDGIAEVNQALGQMDQVTQQNAALGEEAAAAADSTQAQAQVLLAAVKKFKLNESSVKLTQIQSRPQRTAPLRKALARAA